MEFTYQDYLDEWQERFGEESSGEFVWFRYGTRQVKVYPKMTEPEFEECVQKFGLYFEQLTQLLKARQFNDEYEALLTKSLFECELPLFL